jgi:lipoyl(octanoyl) transferase
VGRLADWRPGLTVAQVQPLIRDAFAARFDLAWSTEA